MRESKLIELYKCLNNLEVKKFRLFISSPYFNKHDYIIDLNTWLVEFYPQFDAKDFTKTEFVNFYKKRNKDVQNKLKYWMSEMTALLEEFLINEENSQNDTEQRLSLLKRFRRDGNEKRFEQLSKKINWSLNHANAELIDFYDYKFRLNQEQLLFQDELNIRDYNQGLIEANQNLDIRFLIKKLEFYAELLNKRIILNTADDRQAIDLLLQYIEAEDYQNVLLLRVYYYLVKMLLHSEKEKYFIEYCKTLQELKNADKNVLWGLYIHALNYAATKSNIGKLTYLHRYNDLIKEMIERKILVHDNQINPWLFKNIVTQSLKIGEMAWANQFIENHKSFLPEEDFVNHQNYNLAHVAYYQKDLSRAQGLLQKVEFTDVFLNIGTKVILLKVYYESDQIELLDAHLKAFKMYIYRNKSITNDKKQVINKLIDYTNRLKNLISSDQSKLRLIKKNLEKEKVLDKDWLVQMIDMKN